MTGSEGGSDCEMVDVFPNSSLETPASEDVGISVQRHGEIICRKGRAWRRLSSSRMGMRASNA